MWVGGRRSEDRQSQERSSETNELASDSPTDVRPALDTSTWDADCWERLGAAPVGDTALDTLRAALGSLSQLCPPVDPGLRRSAGRLADVDWARAEPLMREAAIAYLDPSECDLGWPDDGCPLPSGWEYGTPNGFDSLPVGARAYAIAWATELNRLENASPMLWMQLAVQSIQHGRSALAE